MIDYQNILRLHNEGHSQREIERELYCSRHTISDVLNKVKATGISWPLGDDVTNENDPRAALSLQICLGVSIHTAGFSVYEEFEAVPRRRNEAIPDTCTRRDGGRDFRLEGLGESRQYFVFQSVVYCR